MLLDSVEGLGKLQQEFSNFLMSSEQEVSFVADTRGSPEPYDGLLNGLRVSKTENENSLVMARDKWLELSASQEQLKKFLAGLNVTDNHDHHHWYSTPYSLIIEADDYFETNDS